MAPHDPENTRARRRSRDDEEPGPGARVVEQQPAGPTRLPARSWFRAVRGTFREFQLDELSDRAAALTYYSVLSVFPALLVMVSVLGLAGQSVIDKAIVDLQELAPGPTRDTLIQAVRQLQGRSGLGSLLAVVGVLVALWSASSYVAAFIRTANVVYDMPEGRPIWKVLPVRLGVTVLLLVLAIASTVIAVFTGGLARRVGGWVGLGDTALTVWSIAKWPALVVLATLMIALLYWAAPNAKGRGFRWITPGSVLALVIWMAASAGFAVYVANFASYNKTYGTLAGAAVFLVWLWITNLAITLGLEFDAELARERAVAGGYPRGKEPYVQPRDTRAWSEEDRRQME
ncbi:YihY/virulence factor BrkB family protein [Streptomyces sp. NBC_01198]|uniref:YihY/virulence factor BrkB family protein n=1 Tax=Streptomyces sp. NBC_01198 TaxID=2903769 RepID=UPI002E108B77|nr:YihY/virulence factor BrkB family protein [Streptomyces sp. NBC_01198]